MTVLWTARVAAERLRHQLIGVTSEEVRVCSRFGPKLLDVECVELTVSSLEERDVFGTPTGESALWRRIESLVDSGEYMLRSKVGEHDVELEHVRSGARLRILDERGRP